MLSLLSALLIISVQGYWLYTQYRFVLDNYADELSSKILETTEGEYEHRFKHGVVSSFTFSETREYGKDEKDGTKRNTNYVFDFSGGKLPRKDNKLDYDSLVNKISNALMDKAPMDTMRLSFTPEMMREGTQIPLNRYLADRNFPFSEELLDSMLTAELPGLTFSYQRPEAPDTIYKSYWELEGTLFSPKLRTVYVYNPLELKSITIETLLPAQPLLNRMAMQLFLAFGLILLLIGCLIFQIKTILKQKKIGELRQSFVNTMIHELKRPVQTLKTFFAFLNDKDMRADENTTERVLEDSMFELDNLSAYLEKLKGMMHADNPETSLNPTRFDLKELVEKVIRLIHIPPRKEVEFSTVFDMESPLVEADPVHLANALSNLAENAIKYSGQKVRIEIKAVRKGKELHLGVSDNGIGIPLAERDRVFAKFYRGSNLPDRDMPGLGLGLSYVKLIGEAHRGRVDLQSQVGQGTTVVLHLPQ